MEAKGSQVMTTQDALLADILAKPDDDLPRLALCDWWDEFGTDAEKVRSEFVRVQVELEKRGPYCHKPGPAKQVCIRCIERYHLKRRQMELWTAVGLAMRDQCLPFLDNLGLEEYAISSVGSARCATIRRGFPQVVYCTLADWCGWECHQCAGTGRSFPIDGPSIPCRRCGGSLVTGIGPEVVRRHPVTTVVLTDREPGERNSLWFWYFDSGWSGLPSLPTTLNGGRQEQRCYESERAAVEDASRRVIAWAKARVASEAAVV